MLLTVLKVAQSLALLMVLEITVDHEILKTQMQKVIKIKITEKLYLMRLNQSKF